MNFVVSMFIMFASIHFHKAAGQTRFVVGDAVGWTVPTGGAVVYATWASRQTFMVGDILVFNFTNGKQDVAEVSAMAYRSCTFTNPTTVTNGPASITLTTTGNHYYVCTITSHCQNGQKLTINVVPTDNTVPSEMTPITPGTPSIDPTPTSPPPSATPDPPISSPSSGPSTLPTITSSNTTTPPPPPTSGAPSCTTMVLANFLAVGLAFLYY